MATLEKSPYQYKSKLDTLQERQQSAGFSATDYGRVAGMAYSAQAAWDRNITMSTARWVKTKALGDKTSPRVTREDFAKSYAPIVGLEYKENENRAQLDYRISQGARFARQSEMIEGENRMVSNFAASFGAGIFDPVNLIPFALPAKGARATVEMYKASGNRAAAAYHQGKLTFKNVLAVNGALEVPYAYIMNDTGVEQYTQDHLKMSVGMNLALGGLFGVGHGYFANRAAGKVRNVRRELEKYNQLMEADDFATPLQMAIDDNPSIKSMIMNNPRLRDFISGKDKDGANLNADDLRLAVAALDAYTNNRNLIAMRQDIAQRLLRDPEYQNKSMLENRKALTDKMSRIVEAVLSGKLTKKLTKDDLALLKKYNIELSNEGDVVYRSQSKNVPSNHPAMEHVESYAMLEESKNLTLSELELSKALYDEDGNPRPLTPELEADIARLEIKVRDELIDFYNKHGSHLDKIEKKAIDMVNKSFNLKIKGKKFEIDRQVLTALQDIRKGYHITGAVLKDQPQIRAELPHRTLSNIQLTPFDSGVDNFFINKGARNKFISVMYSDITGGQVRLTPKEVNKMYSKTNVDNALFSEMYSTMMHEAVHVLQENAPQVIDKLREYASRPQMVRAIHQKLTLAGYSTGNIVADLRVFAKERPAVLLQWAVTQEAYWKVLQKEDKSLFNSLRSFIMDLANNFLRYLGKNEINFSKLDQSPEQVAKDVAKIMSGIRKDVSLGGRLKKAYDENPTPSALMMSDVDLHKPLISTEQGTGTDRAPALSKTYENNNFNNRANEMDKYSADPKKYLEDTISRLAQDDTLLPKILEIAKIKEKAKRQKAIAELVEGSFELNIPFTTADVNNMVINLDASMKRSRLIYRIAKLNDPNKILAQLAVLRDKGLPLEPAQRLGFLLLQENKSPIEKLADVRKYLVEEDHAMILRTMHDASVKGKLQEVLSGKRTAKAKLAQLKTIMDGSRRAGVDLGPSIQRQVETQIRKDQLPLLDYLTQHDLEVIFLGEDTSHYMSSYKKAAFDNPALIKTYGNDVKAASKQMHIDIMTAMTTGKMPKRWEGIPVWEGLVDVIRKTNKGQMAEINYLGVNMRQREGFSGYSMRYDRAVVASMTEKEFVSKMMRMMDLGGTFRLHGGLMEPPTLADDKAKGVKKEGAYVKFNHRAMLSTMYNEIVNGKFELDPDVANPSAVGSFRKSMKIAFKPQYEIEARIEFGNYKSLGRLMLEQIRGRSERIALVKHLGHDANGVIKRVAKQNGLDDGSLGYRTFEATVDQITGVLDNPADVELSTIFKKVRSVSNLAYLSGSGLSTLSDVPLSLATLSFLGMDGRGFTGFVDAYKAALATHFKGDNKKMQGWYRAQGAGFDLVMRTYASRVVTEDGKGIGWIDAGNNALFEINGLNRFTAAHQQIFIDFLSAGLAKQLRAGKINDLTMARMVEFGFTPDEVMSLAKYVEKTPDGVYRIGPSTIGDNTPLQRKLSGFYSQYMKEAVIEPDAGAQAISRLGLQAGTFAGETARVAFQYSSFMLGMSRVVYRRFMNGYTGDKKQQALRNSHLIAYLGTALAFAYITTVFKDLSRLKEPISPLDMSENDMLRLLSQSGVLGVLELPLNAQRFGADAAFAPLVGAGKDVLSGDIKQAVDPFLGTNYPLIGPLMKKVSFVASETLNNIAGDELERVQNLDPEVRRAMQMAAE